MRYVVAAIRYGLFSMDNKPAPIDGLARDMKARPTNNIPLDSRGRRVYARGGK